jgi:hypothetical protein
VDGDPLFWDYSESMAPSVVDAPMATGAAPPLKFEQLPLELKMRTSRRAAKHCSRVGGEPGFHQLDIIAEVAGLPARAIPQCLKCRKTMPLIAQWTESFRRIPRAVSPSKPTLGVVDNSGRIRIRRERSESEGPVMGHPGLDFWFGCSGCKIVATLREMD